MSMYNIMIVDDEPILRNGIKNFIDWKSLGCEVCCLAENGEDALRKFRQYSPDIVITDIRMPGIDGLDLARRLSELSPKTKVIILTGYSDFSYAQRAIRYSVVDFVVKNNPAPKICEAVKKAISLIEKERKDHQFFGELEDIVNQSYDDLKAKLFLDIINQNVLLTETIEQKAAHLGVSLSAYRLAVIGIPDLPSEASLQQVWQSVRNFSLSLLLPFKPFAFALNAQTLCLILIPTEESGDLNELCGQIVSTLFDITGFRVRIGVSEIKESILAFSAAYREALSVKRDQNRDMASQFLYHGESADDAQNPTISEALRFIHAHYKEDITLRQISDELHLNASYLSRLFKKHMKETIVGYITRYRIECSKKLLLHSDARLYTVAIEAGFNDAAYFSNIFKKYTGYSPSEYKSKFSEKEH